MGTKICNAKQKCYGTWYENKEPKAAKYHNTWSL